MDTQHITQPDVVESASTPSHASKQGAAQRYRRALEQARKITGMLQGTMGLEGQALDKQTLKAMTRRTAEELLRQNK